MKIGVIGYGHMASSIVKGWLKAEVFKAEEVYVTAKHYGPLKERAESLGLHPCKSSKEVLQKADWILYGGPADSWKEILLPLAEDLEGKVLISIAAGVHFEDYESTELSSCHHLSILPSLPVEVNQGVILAENKSSLSSEEKEKAKEILSSLGLFEEIESELLSAAGSLTGCGPALVYAFMEGLSDVMVQYGLKRDQAYTLSCQMILGSAALQKETGIHPSILKEAVATPGGTTIRALNSLHRTGFSDSLVQAMEAILK